MRNYIEFAGQDLREFGLYISGSGTFNAPERQYDEIIVPGRNGVLLGDQKRMENIEVTYPAFMYSDFKQRMQQLRSFLLSKIGYQRLTDTYHPEEYRLAVYRGGTEVEPLSNLRAGQFDLTFWCKPQRYLLSGEEVQVFTEDGTITNPTMFDAYPLIRVYGTGEFTVNDTTVQLAGGLQGYTDLNCEIQDAYHDISSRNSAIQLSGNSFPILSPGENTIELGTGITQLEITPRWWQV